MSPEQLNDAPIDGRSDLFSLGVILYMLLTGHRPFQGNSPITISLKVVSHEPVPAIALEPDLPEGLDYVLSRALAKNPGERYQRGMEMSLDLQNVLAGHEPWSKTKQQSAKPADRAPWDRVPLRDRVVPGLGIHAKPQDSRGIGDLSNFLVCAARRKWNEFPFLRPLPFLLLVIALYGTSRYIASTRSFSPGMSRHRGKRATSTKSSRCRMRMRRRSRPHAFRCRTATAGRAGTAGRAVRSRAAARAFEAVRVPKGAAIRSTVTRGRSSRRATRSTATSPRAARSRR